MNSCLGLCVRVLGTHLRQFAGIGRNPIVYSADATGGFVKYEWNPPRRQRQPCEDEGER